jgi:prepilin-type N-terminal cleavage/methylation domain-containing protein
MSRKQHGFTLIEIIVSLILVGIITVFAGMGLVQTVESYIFSRDTVTLTEKAQLAMTRVALELNYLDSISRAEPDLLHYTSGFENNALEYQLKRSGNKVFLKDGQVDHLLIDGLGSYASAQKFLRYKKDDESAWVASEPISDLAFIEINLFLQRPGGSVVEYTSLIDVRNNKRANAVLPNL